MTRGGKVFSKNIYFLPLFTTFDPFLPPLLKKGSLLTVFIFRFLKIISYYLLTDIRFSKAFRETPKVL